MWFHGSFSRLVFKARFQAGSSCSVAHLILLLRALLRALDRDAGRDVLHANRRLQLIDVLAACATRPRQQGWDDKPKPRLSGQKQKQPGSQATALLNEACEHSHDSKW